MIVSEIKIYDFLRLRLNLPDLEARKYTQELVDAEDLLLDKIDRKVQQRFEDTKSQLATKEDIHFLKDDIQLVKGEIHLVKEEIFKLEIKTEQSFNLQLKWFIGIALTMCGLFIAAIKFL